MFAADLVLVVVLFVNLDFIRKLRDVRNVDLDRAIAKRLHELVVLKSAVLWLVRVPEDHFVDIGLRKLLWLDLVFLAGAQQVIQERHIELQHLDKLDQPAVGDVEFSVEIERAGIAVAPILRDFPVVDVAGELGRILVLLVFRLERADADAILFAKDQTLHADVLYHARPVAIVLLQSIRIDMTAIRA